ncbi:B12-binding domain-containing radical SAM protein [Alkaliphilus hydrothermalis]|uniref:Radical SAM superfamily enzyme YgiQ (UPF0313 family) n=1 Tax=Alkaliphilus hydrothermalis TaxID=1482730 RepID=A0ABS2NSG0_9FIRM|nr:radical SAM protein [Alkaliphilus hydrothermalis]MBM7615504.1 radical SAM superfamily enzyme YgiQ (UPF0313 family) [Alkaliphilus hydrothermalis]
MPSNNKTSKVGYTEKSTMPPLGIISIGAYLQMHGYSVEYIDLLSKKMTLQEFKDSVLEINPDIVGISAYTETYSNVITISKIIKDICNGVPVVLGGPHVSFLSEEALANQSVDYVIRAEGETTFVELLETLNYGTIPFEKITGLSYKNENCDPINNEERKFISNLDALPWVELEENHKKNYYIKQLFITSRGCPGQCIYCASASLAGRKYRARSAESVFSEIFYKAKYKNEKYFAFLDDTFTADKKRLIKFCNYVKESNLEITWRCDSRADILTYEMVDMMKEVGCIAVHIGIESGCQNILDEINKNISLEKTEKLIKYITSKGIDVMCSFIVGHHCDTHESVRKTIDLANRIRDEYKAVVALSANTPFPGTELYKNMDELGVKLEIKNWSSFDLVQVIISTKNLTRSEIQSYLFQTQNKS